MKYPTAGRAVAVGLGPTPELRALDRQIRLMDGQIRSLQAQRSPLVAQFRHALFAFVAAGDAAHRTHCRARNRPSAAAGEAGRIDADKVDLQIEEAAANCRELIAARRGTRGRPDGLKIVGIFLPAASGRPPCRVSRMRQVLRSPATRENGRVRRTPRLFCARGW